MNKMTGIILMVTGAIFLIIGIVVFNTSNANSDELTRT